VDSFSAIDIAQFDAGVNTIKEKIIPKIAD
jgi:hypothetical protein